MNRFYTSWRRIILVIGVGLHPSLVHAGAEDRWGQLSKVRDEVVRARGPAAYLHLRRLWAEWDSGDPAEVEELIHQIGENASIPPPVRAYANLLEAYARRRRGDLEGAEARIRKLGYVERWQLLGPFDNEGKSGLLRDFGPEHEDPFAPSPEDHTYAGKERPVRWRTIPNAAPYGWFDVGAYVRPEEPICAYAKTYVRNAPLRSVPGQASNSRPISIWAGSAGAMRIFWNGTEVIRDDKYRGLDADRLASRVVLQPGWNALLVKLCGTERGPMLSLRLAAADGSPDASLAVDPNPPHEGGEQAAASPPKAAKPPPPQDSKKFVRPAPADGALASFERLIQANDPSMLEAFARYLVITQSDDPADNLARSLATRAAQASPTLDRLLLAGDLSENRNQRANWLDKADAYVARTHASTSDTLTLAIARANHIQSGPNRRDALPHYERILALDPDNVPATLARSEFLQEAGLQAVALEALERAVERRPRSIALLRATVKALRDQSRIAEADSMAARYAELRFDDSFWIESRIELALARRDKVGAARWIERLLVLDRTSSAMMATAARAYMRLGETARAVALLRRAQDLAPEDTDTMRALADTYALTGQADLQLLSLRRLLELKPQDKDAREYVAHTEPSKPRPDEAYTRPASDFLRLRRVPGGGRNRRSLVDLQVTTVFPNGLASRFRQVVFQPLSEAAAAEAREYSFGYQADSEVVQLRGARVHRVDGRIDEVADTNEGSTDDPSNSMYSSARSFYVQLPRIEVGDVVEILYRVEDIAPRNNFADYFGEVAYLQSDEPIAHAEYVLITPKTRAFYFNRSTVPALETTVVENGDQRIYRFVAANVPAIEPEALGPPYGEILGHVHVSTYKSWEDVGRWYWGLVRDQFIPDEEVKRRVGELTRGLTKERDKVNAIYDYVVQKTRYVALEFGIYGFKPYRCAQIFARGFGDCKDKATLLVTMLKEVGIPATIVIVRSGLKGDFESEPASLAPFDHAIAYVPSLNLYLDGTAEYTGSSELPAMDEGALALQINEGNAKLLHLPRSSATDNVIAQTIDVQLDADGSATIDGRAEVKGIWASGWRRRFHAETTRAQRVQEDLGGEFNGITITSVDAKAIEDIDQSVALSYRGKADQIGRWDATTLSVPVGPKEFAVKDLAPLSQRRRDLQMPAAMTRQTDWTIHLPRGGRIVRTPATSTGTSQFGSYQIEAETTASSVRVKMRILFTKPRVTVSEYADFRKWCETIDSVLGQRVSLEVQ